MSEAYVSRVCGACKHFAPVTHFLGVDVGECQNNAVPVDLIILAPSQAARWGCVLFESKLPPVTTPDPTD